MHNTSARVTVMSRNDQSMPCTYVTFNVLSAYFSYPSWCFAQLRHWLIVKVCKRRHDPVQIREMTSYPVTFVSPLPPPVRPSKNSKSEERRRGGNTWRPDLGGTTLCQFKLEYYSSDKIAHHFRGKQ